MFLGLTLQYPNNFGDVINVGFEWIMCAVNLYMDFVDTHRTLTMAICIIVLSLIIGIALIVVIKPNDEF